MSRDQPVCGYNKVGKYYLIGSLYKQAEGFWQDTISQNQGKTILIKAHDGINRCLVISAILYTGATSNKQSLNVGLGLYISRQIINAHGGKIGVNNTRQGASFWFTLPIAKTNSSTKVSNSSTVNT